MSQELQDFEDPILSQSQHESEIKQILKSKKFENFMFVFITVVLFVSYFDLHKYCLETPNLNAAIFYCAIFLFSSTMLAASKILSFINEKFKKLEAKYESK